MIEERGGQDTQSGRVGDLVLRYRVCWEVDAERTYVNHELRTIGFSLQLFGTHEPGAEHVSPGCEHCRIVQAALKKIIHSILPRDERLSRYEATIETKSLSYSHQRGDRPDVRATIRILHRGAWDHQLTIANSGVSRTWSRNLRNWERPREHGEHFEARNKPTQGGW